MCTDSANMGLQCLICAPLASNALCLASAAHAVCFTVISAEIMCDYVFREPQITFKLKYLLLIPWWVLS